MLTLHKNMAMITLGTCICLSSCYSNESKNESEPVKHLQGTYQLIDLEAQEASVYTPMKGVGILKIFTKGQWISPAYLDKNKKVVNLAGGTYTFSHNELTETLNYHSKDTINIGLATKYKVILKGDTMYQSGVFKPGTPEEWKVEERWLKID